MRLAVQMYTLRDYTRTAAEFEDALRRVAEMGYPGVQFSAVACMSGDNPEVSAAQARKILDRYGLICCATHRGWDQFAEIEREIESHQTLGCGYTAIATAPKWAYEQGLAGFTELAHQMGPVIERLGEAGIQFGYHNHAVEFERLGPTGERPFEVMMGLASPRLQFEMDTYWVNHAGMDVLELTRAWTGRLSAVHLKDKGVFGWEVDFCPVGEGNLDWARILPAFRAANTEWLIVEQDTCRRDPFDCLASSYAFLCGA
jgi:sugar phosphate isomerase/epimerase